MYVAWRLAQACDGPVARRNPGETARSRFMCVPHDKLCYSSTTAPLALLDSSAWDVGRCGRASERAGPGPLVTDSAAVHFDSNLLPWLFLARVQWQNSQSNYEHTSR